MCKILATFFVFLVIVLPSYAVKMKNLYQVDLPVQSQSSASRRVALKEGLSSVLVKLSGKQDVLLHPQVKPYLSKSEDLVEEYSYTRNHTSHLSGDYLIRVRYNREEIDQLLELAKIASWGENRPLTLVWLTVKDRSQASEIVANDKSGPLLNAMQQFSERYGLPLIFPVMDMQDMAKVTPENVADMDLAHLQLAGQRYSADVMLVGSIEFKDDQYFSEWRLLANQTKWSWGLKTKTAEEAIWQVLNQAEETLAQHFVVAPDNLDARNLSLSVSNIQGSDDLLHLIEHLKNLKSLSDVELKQVRGTTVEVVAHLRGSIETLQQNTRINRHMVLKSQAGENTLYFEWVG